MSDLIDRQAALNALTDAVKSVGVLDADDIKTVFDALPSVQPEKTQLSQQGATSDIISRQAAIDALDFEIVHMTAYCDGKNEGNPLAQYNKGLEDGKKAIEALPSAQPEPQWIPCEDCERRCKRWGNLKTLQE